MGYANSMGYATRWAASGWRREQQLWLRRTGHSFARRAAALQRLVFVLIAILIGAIAVLGTW